MAFLSDSDLHGYSGNVYERDTGKPLISVAVSNGRDVTLTDASGHYSLKGWHKANFITVTAPTGYWATDYYIPVSEKKNSYDFSLERLENDLTDHIFLQVTDSEVGKDGAGEWVSKLRRLADQLHPAFIIHTGDICYLDGLKAHIRDMNSENMGIPVRYVIGNHDYVNWGEYGEALFESIYGPVMYSFDVGRIHYIVTPIVYGDVKGKYTQSDVVTFVENDLKYVSTDKKVIMFNHDYCQENETGFVLSDGDKSIDLKEHDLLAWVFGHWHYNYLNEINGIFNITTSRPDRGGIDASPATIRSVVIRGGRLVASDCYYSGFEEARQPGPHKWRVSLGGNILYSSPVARGGVIYVGTVDDGWPKHCGIAAIEEETGKLLWKRKTKNSVKSDICVTGNKILAQDTEGNVYCFGLMGEEIWTTTVALLCPNNSSNSIAVTEDHVYCGGQQHVYCLNLSDGSIAWHKTVSAGNTSPSGFVLYEGMLFVGAHWDQLYALDAATGRELWTNKGDRLSYFITTPAVYKGYLYAASWGGLYKVHVQSGKTAVYRDMEGYTFKSAATPYFENGIMYLGTADRGVVAVDAENLEILWNFQVGKSLIYTSPYSGSEGATVDSTVVPIGDNLCFGASDGFLYIIDKNGKKVAAYDTGAPVNQRTIVGKDSVIVADFGGNITCFACGSNVSGL